jgi:hypothetical protein
MIQANELRIGNYYNWYAEGKYYTYQVSENDFDKGLFVNFYPIPIDEKWLTDFGFVTKYYRDDNIKLPFYKLKIDDYSFELDYEFAYSRDDGSYLRLKNIHSLQNLYWCLVGKELELKQNTK